MSASEHLFCGKKLGNILCQLQPHRVHLGDSNFPLTSTGINFLISYQFWELETFYLYHNHKQSKCLLLLASIITNSCIHFFKPALFLTNACLYLMLQLTV